jgi:hypothetical protein
MRDKLEISAVRKIDLEEILRKHGLPAELNDESVMCSVCAERISWDNLGGAYVKDDKLIFFCTLSDCVEKASKSTSNKTS